jgi:hypothetical protein
MSASIAYQEMEAPSFPWSKSSTPLEISDYQLNLSYRFKHDKAEGGKEVRVFQPTLATA